MKMRESLKNAAVAVQWLKNGECLIILGGFEMTCAEVLSNLASKVLKKIPETVNQELAIAVSVSILVLITILCAAACLWKRHVYKNVELLHIPELLHNSEAAVTSVKTSSFTE